MLFRSGMLQDARQPGEKQSDRVRIWLTPAHASHTQKLEMTFLHASAIVSSMILILIIKNRKEDFPDGPVVENLPASARGSGSIPGPGRSNTPQSI